MILKIMVIWYTNDELIILALLNHKTNNMSLKEYEDLDKIRLEEGKKSREHYKSLNLPGDRTKLEGNISAARERIAKMAEERKKANQG